MCGIESHWSRTCRTLKHSIDLYKASIKERKINFIDTEDLKGYYDTLNIIVYLDRDDHDFVDQEDHKDDG